MRFRYSEGASSDELISLQTYVDRMKDGQKEIYYITGDSRESLMQSPHLEVFKDKGIDVLFMVDPIDEWVTQGLMEFDGKPLKNITQGDVDLDGDDKKETPEAEGSTLSLIDSLKARFTANIENVRLSKRLKDSPSCLVSGEGQMNANMERIMKMSGQEVAASKRILELNPDHPITKHAIELIEKDSTSADSADWMDYLYKQAAIAEGSEVENPMEYVRLVNKMMADKL
jgi:molecular chaperone HtpG